MAKIAKDSPLSEITIRRYEKPNLEDRELVRKICLSFGVLQPGDSRDIIVDILYVMLKENREMNAEQVRERVIEERKTRNLELLGIASPNIRRQMRRLREIMLIEKRGSGYRITENLPLREVMKNKIERFIIPQIVERIYEYLDAVDREFKR